MANAYTDIQSGASLGLNLVKTAYEKLVGFQLRSEPLFRRVADTRPASLTNPGSTVVFNLYNDLAPTTTPLDEVLVPDSVAVPSTSTVSVTLNELGTTVIPTLALRTYSFSDVDPAIANIVARHMADSLDEAVQNVLRGGTNRAASNSGVPSTTRTTNQLTTSDVFKSAIPAAIVAKMRGQNVIERFGNRTFAGFLHPDVAHDFRRETGNLGWYFPHAQVAPQELWLENTGVFGGVTWIESPRCFNDTDGSGGARVYRGYIIGQQALAEVEAVAPHLIIGLPVDPMMRFRPLSWHGTLGWAIYRQEAIWRIETTSSIATF